MRYTAIPVLLEQLDLAGCIVTLDAMGTQSTIAQQIQHQQADYILALKHNHPTLAGQAKTWFEHFQAHPLEGVDYTQYQHCESGHHRIESRTVWQFPVAQIFSEPQQTDWLGLQSLVVIHSHRRLWHKTTAKVRYFLSSLSVDAQAFAQYIRAHWGIENQLHWCLDVVFAEDACRVRKDHAPRNLSLLRRLALNLLRQEPSKASLTMKRYRAGLDNEFLLKILSTGFAVDKAQSDP